MSPFRYSLNIVIGLNSFSKRTGIVVGVDATNLRRGGGRTHLIELLREANLLDFGIDRVVVWGGRDTLNLLVDKPWLDKRCPPSLDGNLVQRSWWQRNALSNEARAEGVDVLFVPGGNYAGDFHPVVTMSRNMLPFDWGELLRYGLSFLTLKLTFLRITQSRTYSYSDGIVFLTHYAKNGVQRVTGALSGMTAVIPHGMNNRFINPPRNQRAIEEYSTRTLYRILYVSIIDQYKHQWHVVEAVAMLRAQTGWPLALDLVGPSYPPALKRLDRCLREFDPKHEWVYYHGAVAYDKLHSIYANADLGVFASSCENMPNILLETMAAGLPVASSDKGPMPEILGDAGVYFNPEKPDSIVAALKHLIRSAELRAELAQVSYEKAKGYSWDRCSRDTFRFMVDVFNRYNGSKIN